MDDSQRRRVRVRACVVWKHVSDMHTHSTHACVHTDVDGGDKLTCVYSSS